MDKVAVTLAAVVIALAVVAITVLAVAVALVVDCCLPSPPEEDHCLPPGRKGRHEDIKAQR
jgi:hypothetical protein